MAKHLYKIFFDEQIQLFLKRYLIKEIKIHYILEIIGVKRSRFLEPLSRYRNDPRSFYISSQRKAAMRRIASEIERILFKNYEQIYNDQWRIRIYN